MARRALGPATLQVAQAVAAAVGEYRRPLLVACSGGADSLALAAGAVHVARRQELTVEGVVVDHGLQAESATVAGRAVAQAARLGLSARVLRVQVDPTGVGVEAAARQARYDALESAALPGRSLILLGHTLDDQAETVLLGLARGSGTRSLAGMPARRGHRLRPLLGLRRSVTVRACAELGLDPWQDPHNADPLFARARVRHEVLPVLEDKLGPGIAEALARTAELAQADADYLDQMSAHFEGTDSLSCDVLVQLHPAVRRRVLRRWLIDHGSPEPTLGHVQAVETLVVGWRGQKGVDVAGVRVIRRARELHAVAG